MKKAKIILTTITILAVVGGALAFKAKRTFLPAYATTGPTATSFTRDGNIYRTMVLLGTFTGVFIDPNGGAFTFTFTNVVAQITGYTIMGGVPLNATALEVVYPPTFTATTDVF
jgi:hypothetical protein